MATSGTVGQTTYTAIDIIDHSIIRCGISPAKITTQMIETAKKNMWLYMLYLSNKGINLWTIEKEVYGLQPNKAAYAMPAGTIEILNLLYRTQSIWSGTVTSSAGGTASNLLDRDTETFCQQTTPNGNFVFDTGSTLIVTVGVLPYGDNTYNLVWSSSPDGITYTPFYSPGSTSYTDGIWSYYDIPAPSSETQYIKVAETGGATLALREVVLSYKPNEIPISRNNRDDYANLPDKTMQSRFPTQYWYNRKMVNPEIVLWPVPNDAFMAMVVWRSRQIQDVGQLTNEVEFPQRWYECVLNNTAIRNALDIPGVDPARITMLGALAAASEEPPYNEERDRANSYFTPNIGGYTRGGSVR